MNAISLAPEAETLLPPPAAAPVLLHWTPFTRLGFRFAFLYFLFFLFCTATVRCSARFLSSAKRSNRR